MIVGTVAKIFPVPDDVPRDLSLLNHRDTMTVTCLLCGSAIVTADMAIGEAPGVVADHLRGPHRGELNVAGAESLAFVDPNAHGYRDPFTLWLAVTHQSLS